MGLLYDLLEEVFSVFLALSFVFLMGLGVIAAIDYTDCHYFGKATGNKTKWAFGCYVEMDGKFVPKKYFYSDVNELRIKAKD